MKRFLISFIALFAVLAIALPSFALEMKYGGLLRARIHSSDNFDGNDNIDDNQNFIEQRLRMFFTFVSSENLQLVTAFEQDTLWGDSRAKLLDGHRDTVGLELKHAYLDYAIPNTPVRNRVGLQPIALMSGWIVDEDFTAATVIANFEPVRVTVGYVAEVNGKTYNTGFRDSNNVPITRTIGVTSESENVDDFVISVDYSQGPFKASLVGFYQDAHNNGGDFFNVLDPTTTPPTNLGDSFSNANNDNLFDLGLNLQYKDPLWSAFFNFVKNFGGFDDVTGRSHDYTGWMVEAGGSFYCGPFTFSLGSFVTSGRDFDDDSDDVDNFVYPIGRSHYWSEIMGFGTLENTINDSAGVGVTDGPPGNRGNYNAADAPSNLWTITAGASWQILDGTKATLNYYYIGTTQSVLSGTKVVNGVIVPDTDSSIGHELDFYLDQKIVDKLNLRLVAAYLFADDAYTARADNEDDNTYELGAQLMWAF